MYVHGLLSRRYICSSKVFPYWVQLCWLAFPFIRSVMLSFITCAAPRHWLAALLLVAGPAVGAPATDPPTRRPPLAVGKPQSVPAQHVAAASPLVAPATPAAQLAASAAPATVQLKGIVLAPNGRPCAGASVYPAGAPRQLVVTDAQGAFALPVPAGAAVALRVEYFGEGSSRVEVPAPGSEPLRITLGQ